MKKGATLADNKSIETLTAMRDHILMQIEILNDKLYIVSSEMLEVGG